jgi:hypothetical protein
MLPELGSRPADSSKTAIAKGSLLGKYVKVVIDLPDPQSDIEWHGVITDLGDDRKGDPTITTKSGTEQYTAYGLTLLLEKSFPVTKSLVKDQAGGDPYLIGICLPFNGGQDNREGRKRAGTANYDATGKCFTDATLTASPDFWEAKDAVEYLLTNFAPTDVDDESKVPFEVLNTDALQYRLPNVAYDGQNVWEILNRLIQRQRGLGFHAVVEPPEAPDVLDVVKLKVFSHSDTDIVLPTGSTIPANSNTTSFDFSTSVNILSATITESAIQTYDRVITRGAPAGVVLTLSPDFNLSEGWSAANKTAYNTAASGEPDFAALSDADKSARNADFRSRDTLHDVFSHWLLPENWDGKGVKLSDETEPLATFTIDDDGTVDLATKGSFLVSALRVADFVPLRMNEDYSTAVTPSIDTDSSEEYLKPILCHLVKDGETELRWVHSERIDAAAASGSTKRQHTFTVQTRIMDDSPGLILEVSGGEQHFIAADQFVATGTYDEIPAGQELDQNDFFATVYLPLQQRVFALEPDLPTSGDVARTLIIDVADAYLDRLIPGTVVGLDNAGDPIESDGGWLRDDRTRLQDIAKLAWTWYSVDRQTLDLQFRGIFNDFSVGQLITSLDSPSGTESINTVITSLSYNLDNGTTQLQTQYDELDFEALV